jgi:hypothetical protein
LLSSALPVPSRPVARLQRPHRGRGEAVTGGSGTFPLSWRHRLPASGRCRRWQLVRRQVTAPRRQTGGRCASAPTRQREPMSYFPNVGTVGEPVPALYRVDGTHRRRFAPLRTSGRALRAAESRCHQPPARRQRVKAGGHLQIDWRGPWPPSILPPTRWRNRGQIRGSGRKNGRNGGTTPHPTGCGAVARLGFVAAVASSRRLDRLLYVDGTEPVPARIHYEAGSLPRRRRFGRPVRSLRWGPLRVPRFVALWELRSTSRRSGSREPVPLLVQMADPRASAPVQHANRGTTAW